jgi:hypothetical protein
MRVHDRVLAVQSSLTGRDLTLMSWLYDHGVLTSPQIFEALFSSTRFGHRRLQRLRDLNLLARFRPLKPDGGSYPYHWLLDQPGIEVIAAQRGDPLPRPGQARTRRLHLTSRANLPHLLGVNGFFTRLAAYQRTHPGARLDDWWPAARFAKDGAFYERGDDLSVLSVRVQPDGYGVWTDHDHRIGFYLEYDTGTEPLTTLTFKIDRYLRLWTGKPRHRYPVLFHLPTARREFNLHQRLCRRLRARVGAGGDLRRRPPRCYWSVTGADVWWFYGLEGPRRLLTDLPGAEPVTDLEGDLAESQHAAVQGGEP